MKHRSPSPKLQSPSSSVIGSDRWMLTQASNDIHLIQQNMYRQYIDQYIMNKFKPTLSQLYPLQSDIHDETEKDEGNPHEAWSLPLLRFVCNVVGNKGNSFAFVLKDMDSI
ncbi:MAG: hypothetical protein EZS28_008780 [Streblomastix strix]|uniref:Uncharacterized protein n=1 Tax=Streblomastix strix TaxID=222440 RepID=A0A5J4WLK4_9EUKA|nr:MAG: hypothetical protein EZS28_008780 [Streblomastix strix]